MRKLLAAIVFSTVANGMLAQDAGQWLPKPYAAPPETLEEFWRQVPLVVMVRIEQTVQRSREMPVPEPPKPFIEHTGRVSRVLKDESQAVRSGGTIQVFQPGGTVVEQKPNPRQMSLNDTLFPVFQVGSELVLFLERETEGSGFHVAYGPSGAFELRNEKVAIPEKDRKMAAFGGRASVDRGEFLEIIRNLPR